MYISVLIYTPSLFVNLNIFYASGDRYPLVQPDLQKAVKVESNKKEEKR